MCKAGARGTAPAFFMENTLIPPKSLPLQQNQTQL